MSDDLEGDFKTFIASANISPAYGFWLDESRITVDIQKLKEIVSRYKKNLNIGLGADGKDVDTYLEEFRKELREAGSEEMVKEVRDQYQAWKTKKEYFMPENEQRERKMNNLCRKMSGFVNGNWI